MRQVAGAVHARRRGWAAAGQDPPSRIPPLGAAIIEQLVGLTLSDPLERDHALDGAGDGISVSSVQRIWRSHDYLSHVD
jgi:hypothetical protein